MVANPLLKIVNNGANIEDAIICAIRNYQQFAVSHRNVVVEVVESWQDAFDLPQIVLTGVIRNRVTLKDEPDTVIVFLGRDYLAVYEALQRLAN